MMTMESTNREFTRCINPATMEEIGKIAINTTAELDEAVKKARAAQKEWAKIGIKDRREYLLKIRDYVAAHADDLAGVISESTGKTRIDAMSTEVLPTAMAINYYARKAGRHLSRKRVLPGNLLTSNKITYIDRVPFGVVGIISPWNYPFGIPFHEIAMALIAGNAVILKVATQTLKVGQAIEECVLAAGLPDGLFTHINLPGRVAGDAFIDSGINKLFFTGSVPVGKYLMKKASERLLPISLELGGNDAMIVCRDANLDRAVAGALWAGLSNSGQSCAGVERILVDEFVYTEFSEKLKTAISRLRQGVDTDFAVEIGSLTTEEQLKTVKRHVEDAVAKGALIYFGPGKSGENNTGYFHAPVILEKVTPDMITMQEETFGPVLALDSFSNIDEAVEKANAGSLGLTASVWTQNKKLAHAVASRLESGAITINDHLMSHGLAESPWGGFKESGYERTHSYLGLEGMTQPRAVIDDILPGLQKNMWWYPHSEEVYKGLRGALHLLYSKKLDERVDGLVRTVKLFMKGFLK